MDKEIMNQRATAISPYQDATQRLNDTHQLEEHMPSNYVRIKEVALCK